MSDLLDSRLTAEQRLECARNDAAMGIRCRAKGNHLAAQNDEPEPSDADFLAADVLRNVNKGERLARANDVYALEIQLQGYIGEVVR